MIYGPWGLLAHFDAIILIPNVLNLKKDKNIFLKDINACIMHHLLRTTKDILCDKTTKKVPIDMKKLCTAILLGIIIPFSLQREIIHTVYQRIKLQSVGANIIAGS